MTPPDASPPFDLSVCEQEPIHLLGSIQPHGMLLAFHEDSLRLEVVSANVEPLLGAPPQRLIGRSLAALLPPEALASLRYILQAPGTWPHRLMLSGQVYTGMLHAADGLTLLELEPAPPELSTEEALASLDNLFGPLGCIQGLEALLQLAVDGVRRLTGFERVMAYRFDTDWHGEVVAESLTPGADSFLGLHFPASDIPAQARRLYTHNTLRLIADIEAPPVPLVPQMLPHLVRPLDLSCVSLRSVSPVHLAYLSNMGVAASFSLSLLVDGRLWGLIACHHPTPRHVPTVMRRACDVLARLLSLQIASEARGAVVEQLTHRAALRSRLAEQLSGTPHQLAAALQRQGELLLPLARAQGAAILLGDLPLLVGRTPPAAQVRQLADWLLTQPFPTLFHTDSLGALYPPAANWSEVASGLLAVRLESELPRFLLWFRPEVSRIVTWAGNPENPVLLNSCGSARLQPRASFAAWKQTMYGHSLTWSEVDQQACEGMRGALVAVLLQQARSLARSNAELEAFSGIVAHDLREPLRGIQQYAQVLREDWAGPLGQEGSVHVREVEWLAQHAQGMLESLFDYSRWGQVEKAWGQTDMQALVDEVLRTLAALYETHHVQGRVPRRLPTVPCDAVRVRQVWANLLSNAARFHEGPAREVEVGYYAPEEPLPHPRARRKDGEYVFYVRDNGIGIHPQFHEAIFSMFRRLHSAEAYGGGTGAGLAIARRLVRLHGGELWVESAPGAGSTFYFTVGEPPR